MDMSKPRFTVGQISKATNVSGATIRTWYARGVLKVGMRNDEIEAEENGMARYLSGYTAICIGIMGALTSGGTPPSVAFSAATKFTYSGKGKIGSADRDVDARAPGELFEEGETILVLTKDQASAERCQILNMREGDDWMRLVRAFGNEWTGAEILRLDDLVTGIMRNLEAHPARAALSRAERVQVKESA